jgi:hypothetical protein
MRSVSAFAKAGTNMGTDNKKCHYIRGTCSYVCRTKQGKQHVSYGELICNTECITQGLRSSGMLRKVNW